MTRSGRARRPAPRALVTVLAVFAVACAGGPEPLTPEYIEALEQHRADRERRLASEDGWLTLVGLHWLEPGRHAFGSDPGNAIVLPEGSAPPVAGELVFDGQQVELIAADGVPLTIGDAPVRRRVLADDNHEDTDVVALGRLRFHVIRRGNAVGLRVKDPESPVRTGFGGLEYYSPDAAYRVDARFVPHPEPESYSVPTVTGTPADMLVPGVVEFSVGGGKHTLLPLVNDPDDTNFFFIIKDGTSGSETYPAGRYLYADLVDGRIDLDFNKAYNPPCAFTPYATCPLPPRENVLDVELRAGERYTAHGKAAGG